MIPHLTRGSVTYDIVCLWRCTVKKIISLVIILSIFMTSTVYGEDTYMELRNELYENSSTIETLELNVKGMKVDVFRAELNAKSMQSQLDFLKSLPFPIATTTTSGLRYVIHIVPQQVGYGLYALENNLEITKMTLASSLRQMSMGLMNAENTYDLDTEKYEFYNQAYKDALLQYDLGLISQTDLFTSEVKKLETETAMMTSKRSLEDMHHTLNSFVGVSLENRYSVATEDQFDISLGSAEELVSKALVNRFEIKDYYKKMEIQQAIIDFYNYGDYLTVYSNWKAMRDAELEKERLELQLKITEKSITEEIYSAVSDIEILDYQIKQLQGTLAMQKSDLEGLKAQAKQGYMTEAAFKELEFAVKMIENNLEMMYYTYNSNMYDLYNASQLGPAYGGGF